ncbi:MAG: hypothetical protein O2794_00830 [bacterium]|nr:hypothetical protein [bacterium]
MNNLLIASIIDFLGFIISLFAIYIVADSSSLLVPPIRRGVLNFIWGLGFMGVAFFWRVIRFFLPAYYSFVGDSFILSLSVLLLLVAAWDLFRIKKINDHAV